MLVLAEQFAQPNMAYLAPEAAGGLWWPQSFVAPLQAIVRDLEAKDVARERIVVAGFSRPSSSAPRPSAICFAHERAP